MPACVDTRERAYRMYRQAGDARGADGRWPALRDDMVKLFERHNTSGGTRVVLPRST